MPEESAAVVPELASKVQWPTNPDKVEVTFSVAVPLMVPEAALIVVLPAVTPVAIPAALTVAEAGAEDVHVTAPVRSWVLESL